MNIDEELDELLNDPLLNLSDKEMSLFDIPADMRKAEAERAQPDHYARRKVCEDFAVFQGGFMQMHNDLRSGKRSLIKTSKTDSMVIGNYYIVDGQMVLLQSVGEYIQAANGTKDGRTRCIFENGTESDILLQTLRKNVMSSGFAITAMQEETEQSMLGTDNLTGNDQVTGYIYILSSLSTQPEIANQQDLYKIGFTTNTVEERIADAANDPTYLMAPVKIEASYKIVNMNSHVFETLIHQVLDAAQMQITVTDKTGAVCHPREWYVVPFPVIDTIIHRILDGSITRYVYNPQIKYLEETIVKTKSSFNTSGMEFLTLNIKKTSFDAIMKGDEKTVYHVLKQTTTNNKYTFIDNADGKCYLRKYDALRLYVGYDKNRESAIVEVLDTTFHDGVVEYHLGRILEHIKKEE